MYWQSPNATLEGGFLWLPELCEEIFNIVRLAVTKSSSLIECACRNRAPKQTFVEVPSQAKAGQWLELNK